MSQFAIFYNPTDLTDIGRYLYDSEPEQAHVGAEDHGSFFVERWTQELGFGPTSLDGAPGRRSGHQANSRERYRLGTGGPDHVAERRCRDVGHSVSGYAGRRHVPV